MFSSGLQYAVLLILPAMQVTGSQLSGGSRPFDNHLVTVERILLPNAGTVNAIVRDDRGFLWFGTTNGLCKYDGYEVRVFKNGSGPDNLQRWITAITKTSDSSLLLATWNGLWTFNLATEQFSPFLNNAEFSDKRIDALTHDSEGRIWIGTRSSGLFMYDHNTQTVRRYTTEEGLSDNLISALLVDHAGILWVGTRSGGVNSLDPSTSRIVHHRCNPVDSRTLSSDIVTSLDENDKQELWIGTVDGLNVLDRATGDVRRFYFSSSQQIPVGPIAHDPMGVVWIGTSNHGIFTHFKGRLHQFEPSLGDAFTLSDAVVTKMYIDPASSSPSRLLLWVGTRAGGVNKVRITKNPFTNSIRNEDSLILGLGAVLSIHEDRKGIVWVGLWGGGLQALERIRGKYRRIARYNHNRKNPFSLPNDAVSSILEDREGTLWVGTYGGLAAFDPDRKRFTVYRNNKGDSTSLAGNSINVVYEDRRGGIWVCTDSGLSQLIRGKKMLFRNFLQSSKDGHSIGGNVVTDIVEDGEGNLWTSMLGGGLNRLNERGELTRFLHPADTSRYLENWVDNLYEDENGIFWLGTRAGLVNFDPRTGVFTRYNSEQLNEAHIFAIEGDRAGNIWLSTAIGLVRLNLKTQNFLRYGDTHGIRFEELTSTFFRNDQGRLFVGGLEGFAEFIPESVSTPAGSPTIAITGLSIFDEGMPATVFAAPEIGLAYDQNFFSFSFAALDYADPQRNRYAYRMVGINDNWIYAGNRNYASYTNLDPGEYVFQVRGSNSEDVWNETGTSIKITISPPYWQTWWFRVLAIILLVGVLYIVYRYRLKKVLEMERLRLRIADDLHDDVGSNLGTIAMVSRAIQRAPELTTATKKRVAEIYDTAVRTSEGMKDIVWFIKPKNDTLDDLFLRMKDTASSLLTGIQHDFHTPESDLSKADMRISIDFKRNFFLAFKEIMTNIVKHASATKVEIRVEQRNGMLTLVVRDNGRGFDPRVEETTPRGNGLSSLRSRAQSVGSVCEITSEIGKGTTISFSGKL